jgi:hypothetical protein
MTRPMWIVDSGLQTRISPFLGPSSTVIWRIGASIIDRTRIRSKDGWREMENWREFEIFWGELERGPDRSDVNTILGRINLKA